MGNGTSQSVMLGPGRSLGHSMHPARFEKAPAKYAHPNNRVLPKPIAGQKLRCTDNGHILHSAGTIRGLKSTSPIPQNQEDGDPEVLGILKRRSEMIEKDQQKYGESNLTSHRMFYSDTDISQCKPTIRHSPEIHESTSSRRPCGGAAARTNKIKQRKKARAPEPPPNGIVSQFQRRAQSTTDLTGERTLECRCAPDWKPKSRAPQPPLSNVSSVPPPPPPPQEAMRRTSPSDGSHSHEIDRCFKEGSSSVINPSRLTKDSCVNSRLSCSVGDLRFEPRNTVFDSKSDLISKTEPNFVPQFPDPFQREIQAVTKKIALSHQMSSKFSEGENQIKDHKKVFTPKQYYFSDKNAFRVDASKINSVSVRRKGLESPHIAFKERLKDSLIKETVSYKLKDKSTGSPLQRFSPNRKRIKSTNASSKDQEVTNRSKKFFHNEDDSDMDLRPLPVLPRKLEDVEAISSSKMWRALEPDEAGSTNRSTSADSMLYSKGTNNEFSSRKGFYGGNFMLETNTSYNCSLSDSHWTPRQDLDDTDSSSINSDDVVAPKHQLGEFSTRFSLPTVMFSNMRPIGTGHPTAKRSVHNHCVLGVEETSRFDPSTKKAARSALVNSDMNSASHFKKFLGMRNKYNSEEDVSVSDSNWTFGGHGLQQKRGKQYASDLMLSDKKKYELVVKNHFGEFLGDILVTKANDLRNKMKPVDSRNSNFSFYSTEGHVMYLPKSSDCDEYASTVRSKFDKTDQAEQTSGTAKRISDLERNSSLDLVRMLEDDVRRRRSKEKLCIRKQLQMMKRLSADDEETEEEIDEAYFTEPKSLEGSSPLHMPSTKLSYVPELREAPFNNCSRQLTHWTSSPALLDDRVGKQNPPGHAFLSSSSTTSSPDSTAWPNHQSFADKWFQRKQQSQNRRYLEKQRRVSEGDSSPLPNRHDHMKKGLQTSIKDHRKVISGPTKSKKPSIYKQLMDIVRREEKHLKKTQRSDYGPAASRDSSYSQRESSHSSSHDSMSSSYSDSSSCPPDCSGVPANDEFHTSTAKTENIALSKTPPFQVAFVQPFVLNRGYRPVPFDLAVPAAANCRMPTLQERHKFQAVS